MAIFGGFKVLAKSDEVLQNKKIIFKVQSKYLSFIGKDQKAKESLVLELEIFEVRCAIPP